MAAENLRGYNIRTARSDDLDALVVAEQRCYDFPWSRQQFALELQNPVASIDLLTRGETVAGYLCSWLIGDEMQILNVTTVPAFRRQGVGRLLLDHALNRGRRQGMKSAWLEVRAANAAALCLYEGLGFERQGRRRRYYPDGEDALIMVRECAS